LLLLRRVFASLLLVSCLTGCSGSPADVTKSVAAASAAGEPPDARKQARALLLHHEYAAASKLLNRALKLDPTNGDLHFLNGMTYHMLELAGDKSQRALAEVGYQAALRYDPSNAGAAYCSGLLDIETGDYDAAVDRLAQSLLYDPNNENAMRAFGVAAYYAHRPDLALAVTQELLRRHGGDDDLIRTEALTEAALNRSDEAEAAAKDIASPRSRSFVEQRIGQWQSFFQQASFQTTTPGSQAPDAAGMPVTDVPTVGPPASAGNGSFQVAQSMQDIMNQMNAQHNAAVNSIVQASGAAAAAGTGGALAKLAAGAPEPRMAMVDLVIIQTEENSQLAAGVNLLDALTATVQGTLAAATVGGGGGGGVLAGALASGRTLGGSVTVPATNYSLNIANSADDKNDILARPTLVVLDQQPSTFNAGFTLTIAVPGSFGGSLEDKNIGLTLTLTPTFISDDRMLMQVKAGRSFFTPVEINAHGFSQSVEISNVEMTASAAVGMGETLVLSGLAERQQQLSRSQVPGLGDIPVIQYLFANRETLDTTRTVMFLITPHPPKRFHGELTMQNDDSPVVKALKSTESRWFGLKDTPNYMSIMHHFVTNQLYQEYRTGDLLAEHWHRPSELEDRLSQLLELLSF
jgi:type II secretory pathway component GspD/PulD (secretin)